MQNSFRFIQYKLEILCFYGDSTCQTYRLNHYSTTSTYSYSEIDSIERALNLLLLKLIAQYFTVNSNVEKNQSLWPCIIIHRRPVLYRATATYMKI